MKTVIERDDADLLEVVCQLHARANMYTNNKVVHNAYIEAREELDKRLRSYNKKSKGFSADHMISFAKYAKNWFTPRVVEKAFILWVEGHRLSNKPKFNHKPLIYDTCKECDGTGNNPLDENIDCSTCSGTGLE